MGNLEQNLDNNLAGATPEDFIPEEEKLGPNPSEVHDIPAKPRRKKTYTTTRRKPRETKIL